MSGYIFETHEKVVPTIIAQRGQPRCTSANWTYDVVSFKVEGNIAFINLQDTKNANGITPKFQQALYDICIELYNKPQIKVAVFTAAGAYFCTGGAFAMGNDPEQSQYEPENSLDNDEKEGYTASNWTLGQTIYLLNVLPQYKVAAIRGESMGAGNSIIAAMDYVIAPEKQVKMHFMEVKRGVASCLTWQGIISKLGASQTRRFTLVGDQINAEEAKEAGLIQEIYGSLTSSNERAMEKGREIADTMSQQEINSMKNSGPLRRSPQVKIPDVVRNECVSLQGENPDWEAVVDEVIADCGRTGRPAPLRLSQEMWPHKSVQLTKSGQQMARITLTRKQADNAIDQAMLEGLLDAVVELHRSIGKVRLVEVHAKGDVFCSGLDKDLSENSAQVQQMLFLFSMLPMPVLGVVQGRVSGLGVALCSTFDLMAVDAQKAKFNFSGLALDKSGIFTINRIGEKQAGELVKKKTELDAAKAREVKLATDVFHGKQELANKVKEICAKVSLTGPNGVAVQKYFVQKVAADDLTLDTMYSLAGHIGSRQIDPEFNDAIMGIMDRSHKPRYCKTDADILKPYGY